MKKALLCMSILAIAISISLFAQTPVKPPLPEKKLNVELTVTDWGHKLDVIEYTKGALKKSNLPANEVLPLIDSLTKVQTDIVAQLQPQLVPAGGGEGTVTKPDSSKVKKK